VPIPNNVTVFDAAWLAQAKAATNIAPWITDVLNTLDAEGALYLDSVRIWFTKFPHASIRDRNALKSSLENFHDNNNHLGGVNELSWWAFMRQTQMKGEPVATAPPEKRPDFRLIAPSEFFVEVSTLNVSEPDRRNFEQNEGVSLNHSDSFGRILQKVATDKKDQITFAADSKRPCALVLFDYTTWSGYGTQFFRFLANALLGKPNEFCGLPVALSALVYVERKVIDGRIAISRDRSAVYYNPNAAYPLPIGTFTAIGQFWCQMIESQPRLEDHWVWL
jgi:hypothetical protein